ncbi:hypothetical protein [Citricoccus muralis]|uniref:Membrane protein DUF2157 n=1 Tax=Citricoccus muralis TaxID=169134 RepID=A0ABY8H3N1_9MICC|nr:hypothetical protein [Citricoccus muralis]WFP15739.1 hypothetical protein P8192_10060 [Citricoccus muralis]
MSSTAQTIPAAIQRIEEARNQPTDGTWAWHAVGSMVMGNVVEQRIVEALNKTADQLAASQESPEALFGSPRAWDRDQRARWREEGLDITAASRTTARDLVVETLVISSFFAGLFFLYMVISASWGDRFTLSLALAPLLLAAACRATEAIFTTQRRTRSQRWGALAAVATLGVSTAAILGVFGLTNTVDVGVNVLLGLLGVAVISVVAAWATAKIWPEPRQRSARPAPSNEKEWLEALGAALRARGDITDARVREIVAEAQSHAHESDLRLREEFGEPAGYADRFAPAPQVRRRRTAWMYTAVAVLIGIYNVIALIDGAATWWGAAWFALACLFAILEWRKVTRG